jgi:hypothetical protein
MEIWVPQWTVRQPEHPLAGASWFGGIPVGLDPAAWPVCGQCGTALTPLLQLSAGPWLRRIPAGHALLVFKCESDDVCEFWDPDDVANRCLLVPVTELVSEAGVPDDVSTGKTHILPRVWVGEWKRDDDGLTSEQADQIDRDEVWDLPDDTRAIAEAAEIYTKAGGAAVWTGNGPASEPARPRQLLFQIDNWITAVDSADVVAAALAERPDPYVHVRDSTISAANFMSDGVAYVFDVAPDAPVPNAKLVIQR